MSRFIVLSFCLLCAGASAQNVTLVQKAMDPFGAPRPAPKSIGAPIRTSLYFEVGMDKKAGDDAVSTPTIAVTLTPAGGKPVQVMGPGARFAKGYRGWIKPANRFSSIAMGVYLEPPRPLDALTTYTVQVTAKSRKGATFARGGKAAQDRWTFTTAAAPKKEKVAFELDLTTKPVHWQGLFFSGFCKPSFCSSASGLEPSYAMMARDNKQYPKAWVLQRDFWLTGMDHVGDWGHALHSLPNIVRELETRRVAAITTESQGCLLKVEDFFGHAQYGIPSGRPLSADYKPGYEILIADGINYARARVIEVNDEASTVRVGSFAMPKAGFKIDDPKTYKLRRNNPKSPGLFPCGGCYLRRYDPAGTPKYYWGQVDKEWDIARKYGHKLMPNFTDAPGDVSSTGQNWCPPKDYVELRRTVYDITSHTIARYGAAACLDGVWSIFNEPDLGPLFWKGTKQELNLYYDYATDGVLRAFEDAGLDSNKVFIGGLELGGIFWNLPGLDEFLRHCSPTGATTASLNAAYADARLKGQLSRRVETLCAAHGGKGAPLDFISIHAYNGSAGMAAKLALAKDKALAIDPQAYENLWVCSHEATPDWMPSPDESFDQCYLGNGYYPSWCADVVWRQLTRAARDPRYGMGNTLLTYWPWPNGGFGGTNGATQILRVDENGDGKADKDVTVATPVYNFLNLLGGLGDDYWMLPERVVAGHTVTGFAARTTGGKTCVLLYAHDPADVQARAGQDFAVELSLGVPPSGGIKNVSQYRFDKNHHSYFELACKIRERGGAGVVSAKEARELEKQVALRPEKKEAAVKGGKVLIKADLSGTGATVLIF